MSEYFPKPYKHFGGNVTIELDLSYYAKKTRFQRSKRR